MKNSKTISIMGAGALGTALTILIARHKKAKVKLWDRNPEVTAQIREFRESRYLPQKKIPREVFVSPNLKEVIRDTDLTILAVPSFGVGQTAERLSEFKNLPPILLVSKGLEKETCRLPFQIVEEILKTEAILHLAWVGFAKNIEEKIPASETLASRDPFLINEFRDVFETKWLRPEVTDDLLGVELAGALKNVIAIGIGLALTSEKNKREEKLIPGLISLGIREMVKLGRAMGAREQTFLGSVGKEDLKISSFPDSRNYQLGATIYQKGAKKAKKELEETKRTAEGLLTASASFQLAKLYKLQLPIIEEVYKIIYEDENPQLGAKKIIDLVVK